MEHFDIDSDTVGRPMEILLVEDNLVHARHAIGMLRKGNFKHRVTLVRDGEEASDFLQRHGRFAQAPRPDLILLDLELPKKDGRELLAELKGDFHLRSIPVVVLSASEADEDFARTREYGVASHMTKPVDLDQFLTVIRELKRYWHADVILPSC